MYPSKQKAYAGIFVKNQYEEIKKSLSEGNTIDVFYMRRQFTSKTGSIIKYLKAFFNFIPILFKKYDVIHLHFFYPLIYFVWLYKKIYKNTNLVVTFHGSDVNNQINKKNKNHFQKIAKSIDFTISVGKQLSIVIKDKLKITPNKILPVGVNNNIFYYNPTIEKKYDYIFIGSFYKIKGIDYIIEAIEKTDNKSIRYCFCGSGEYLSKLEELQFKGYNITIKQNQTQSQLSNLLNQSIFLLIHSRSEGFPTVTIEAMFCGVPVLTSDIPQFKEQVKDGVNGFLVPLGNVNYLANKIVELKNTSNSDYNKLVEGALNSFKNLSLKNVSKEIITIYKQLADN